MASQHLGHLQNPGILIIGPLYQKISYHFLEKSKFKGDFCSKRI